MSTPITIERDRLYRCTALVFNGLNAQMPGNVGLGGPWAGDEENYSYIDGEMVYRLDENGVSVEDACFAVYGKYLDEMTEDLYLLEAKIWDIADPGLHDSHEDFRAIDYRTGLTCTLYPKRTTDHGEVVAVDWYKNADLTDQYLRAEIIYERDMFGFATKRTTTRKWVMRNGDFHPLTKVTEKYYNINLEDQITEGKRRRRNIVNTLTIPTFGALQAVLLPQGYTPTAVLLLGRTIMDHLEPYFQKFIGNSSTITDINDPNVGRKTIIVELERMAANEYPWFNDPVSIFGGASILQYLSSQFDI